MCPANPLQRGCRAFVIQAAGDRSAGCLPDIPGVRHQDGRHPGPAAGRDGQVQAGERPHTGPVAASGAVASGGVVAQFHVARRAAGSLRNIDTGVAGSRQPARRSAGVSSRPAANSAREPAQEFGRFVDQLGGRCRWCRALSETGSHVAGAGPGSRTGCVGSVFPANAHHAPWRVVQPFAGPIHRRHY